MKHYIINYKKVDEASYDANMGFTEMVNFYQIASKDEISKLERLIKMMIGKDINNSYMMY
jgi:hypothetical protein